MPLGDAALAQFQLYREVNSPAPSPCRGANSSTPRRGPLASVSTPPRRGVLGEFIDSAAPTPIGAGSVLAQLHARIVIEGL